MQLLLFRALLLAVALLVFRSDVLAFQDSNDDQKFTRQDKLRGSITPERSWWDLKHYHLSVEVFPETKSLKGSNTVRFTALELGSKMQIDLQEPLEITRVVHNGEDLKFTREGNVYWIEFEESIPKGGGSSVQIFYEGVPVESKRPPWEGGLTWDKDEKGNHFIATTCQGIGASIWWPCKDHGYDEPDDGVQIDVTVPDDLVAVANGRLKKTDHKKDLGKKTFFWEVTKPINNYCVNVNIGNYVKFSDTYQGEGGELEMDYWVLAHQKETAQKHFKEAPRTIAAFEHWFGKYPFYADSFKLVVVPYLGMEHQSSVTYGNGFQNGYNGRDLSASGVGMLFDFIIVHETGHEWFGNNISMRDSADMWIHESFTNYSENLFVEYHFSKKEAEDYVIGCRKLVQNDQPIIGAYNVNDRGSGDMYYKGGNMLHMIRHIIDDDEKWRSILRGLNQDFWHQTVTTEQIESYISKKAGMDFDPLFDQYLRSTKIPKFKYKIEGEKLNYKLENVVDDFSYPLKVKVNGEQQVLMPTASWKQLDLDQKIESVSVDRNFYLIAKEIKSDLD